MTTYCAEVWQVAVSDAGLVELTEAFGVLTRVIRVKRVLPPRAREGRPDAETGAGEALISVTGNRRQAES
jgi:hypothetical protein